MPEQESSPELQAAREDALKKYREAFRAQWEANPGKRISARSMAHGENQTRTEETNRIGEECMKLGITLEELNELRRAITDEIERGQAK